MRSSASLVAAALAIASLVGCEKEKTETPKAPAPGVPAVDTSKATDLMNKAQDAGNDAMAKASDAATKQLDQAMAYIKDHKIDSAETIVSALERNKDALTPAVQAKLADARKALDAAKAMAH